MAEGPKPTVGRVLHYLLKDGPRKGECRPADVVRVNEDETLVLVVAIDELDTAGRSPTHMRRRSVRIDNGEDPEEGTAHWPQECIWSR